MKIRVARKPANAYQHGNLRDALVQAGLKLLTDGGVANLSLRGAAQLAGVSHAAPYRHFADKDALVAAIAEEGFRLLGSFLRGEAEKVAGGSVRERLQAQGRGYVKFALEHPAYLQVIFGGLVCWEQLPSEQAGAPGLAAASTEAYQLLRDAISEGIARGELRDVDPDVLSLATWSMVHGLSHLLINQAVKRPPGEGGADAIVEAVLRLLGDGIYKPSPS
jgi:AcrR family transcriptional regulator